MTPEEYIRSHELTRMNKEFMEAMRQTADPYRAVALVSEEAGELIEASYHFSIHPSQETAEAMVKEAADFFYVLAGLFNTVEEVGVSSVREHMDSNSTLKIQTASEIILNIQRHLLSEDDLLEATYEVHTSNMSKLDDNGKPVKNSDGKVMKGPNYQAPDMQLYGSIIMNNFNESKQAA